MGVYDIKRTYTKTDTHQNQFIYNYVHKFRFSDWQKNHRIG